MVRGRAWWLPTIASAATLALSGCTIYKTPDGHSFWSANSTEKVQAVLGEPDMIEESQRFMWGSYRSTRYTYLDRGYCLGFINGLVRGVTLISETERPDYERRVRAFKEEISKVSTGDSAAEIFARFGPPDLVVVGYYKGKMLYQTYEGEYHGQLEETPLAGAIYGFWKKQYLFMLLRDGHLAEVRPLTNWDWEHGLHEQPPSR